MLLTRPRRNRKSAAIRSLVSETTLNVADFIYPLFVVEGERRKEEVANMPNTFRFSIDELLKECEKAVKCGIVSIALFPVIPVEKKDVKGSEALNPDGLICKAVVKIKKELPQLCIMADIALDPYTSHGHDGLIDEDGEVMNDESVKVFSQMALLQAEAGIDMVAPSDMMDGRIKAIRETLDIANFENVSIHAYTAKYASCFYGPYRGALKSEFSLNKKSYQMDPSNRKEALLEGRLDENEGADILMVKPAIFYLDVIAALKETTLLPISAFQVSGEYAMLHAAAAQGWLDLEKGLMESLISIKRAGAKMILTYGALKAAELLKKVD